MNVAFSATFSPMATTITQRTLRNENADIMRRLEEGETFLITRNGKQIGILSPAKRSYFVETEALLNAFATAPDVSYAALREDLDAISDQSVLPREK
jgi:antitoxin (DNA-binding transcriptional repressor) of toxin-antitoxin stability system